MKGFVILECASWFEEDDGCIQITNKYGNTVILNKLYSLVWKTIDSEKEISELKEELQHVLSERQMEEIINKLSDFDLASVRDEIDSFDIMF
ncbi:hypothetical protein [Lacrimispora sp.]|uniref:hypothetical protein n=1 Tax=Lacrimispora sp. TaxID=2719234 RepID=UPI003994E2FE